MLRLVIFLFVALVGARTVDRPAPRHVVNLDLPPRERWSKIIPLYKKDLSKILVWINQKLGPLQKFSKELQAATTMSQEMIDEIHSVADAGNFSFADVNQAQFLYELTHGNTLRACTSIVAEKTNGTILHVRNQDLSFPGLDNLTIDVEFQKKGKTIYYGTTFAGYVGFPTGMTPNGYSVAAHTRFELHTQASCIAAAKKGGQVIGMVIRSVLEKEAQFKAGTKLLQDREFIVNCYLISAGTQKHEGMVITRNMDNSQDVWQLTDSRWFEVETNWDHWKVPLDGRRKFANTQMNKTTAAAVDLAYMYKIVSTKPDFAGDTVYTSKMIPSLDYYQSIVRGH